MILFSISQSISNPARNVRRKQKSRWWWLPIAESFLTFNFLRILCFCPKISLKREKMQLHIVLLFFYLPVYMSISNGRCSVMETAFFFGELLQHYEKQTDCVKSIGWSKTYLSALYYFPELWKKADHEGFWNVTYSAR